MRISGYLYTPTNTGTPDYNICGQAPAILPFANTSFKLSISQGTLTPTVLINTNDLNTYVGAGYGVTVLNSIQVNYSNFVTDSITGKWLIQLSMEDLLSGLTTFADKFFVHIEISKTGYQSYTQVFEVYGYDLGNATIAPNTMTGNPDFNIYLVNNTNNLDINNIQTKAFSKVIAYRKPFTNDVYYYNAVGTQGTINYLNNSSLLTTGTSGLMTGIEDVTITETVTVSGNTCSSSTLVPKIVWTPTITASATSETNCGDCSNNLNPTTISAIQDYSLVDTININSVPQFVTAYLNNYILLEQYDYTNILQSTQQVIYANPVSNPFTYALYLSNPTLYLVPITFVINTTVLGDNNIKVCSAFNTDDNDSLTLDPVIEVIKCCTTLIVSACNWWTITTNEECNYYNFNNCKNSPIDIVITQLQSDGTFLVISTSTIAALSVLPLTFSSDGVYVIQVSNGDGTNSYYTLPVFCTIQNCFLSHLNYVLCSQPNFVCNENDKVSYNFNAFIILFQTFQMLLNKEMNYNYLYNVITSEKIAELGTINDYITRLAQYCDDCEVNCIPCQNASS